MAGAQQGSSESQVVLVCFFKIIFEYVQLCSQWVLKLSSVPLGGFQNHGFLCRYLKFGVIRALEDIRCAVLPSFLQTWKAQEASLKTGELHNHPSILF